MCLNGIILIKFTHVLHATQNGLLHVTDKAPTAGNFATTAAGSDDRKCVCCSQAIVPMVFSKRLKGLETKRILR